MDPCVAVVALDGGAFVCYYSTAYSARVDWGWARVGRNISTKND